MGNEYIRCKHKGKETCLHRYIMEQYLGRKLGYNEVVHHINGDKHDNRIENLIVMPRGEHARLHLEKLPRKKVCIICGKEFETTRNKHKKVCSQKCLCEMRKGFSQREIFRTPKKVNQFDTNGNLIKTWNSLTQIQTDLGIAKQNISYACKNKGVVRYGFIWEFANE